ncbi:glycosyltransferase family 2 protein [Candidatus Margulisiibacteriota bacterium]
MSYDLPEQVFKSVSVVLPVVNETSSLKKTVEIIMADCREDVGEIVIVICDKTTTESREVCNQLGKEHKERIKILKQTLPFLGGAMRDSFEYASGSHLLMMASDLETPPDKVKDFVDQAKKHPGMIVTGSRWIKGGGFEGYSRLKFALNFLFQRFFSILYRTRLSDMTYGYRIFPTQLVKSIRWEELRHPFLFETLVKPLRLGVSVVEIPTKWSACEEGGSQNTFMRNFEYFRIGLKTLFYSRRQILK